MMVSRHTNPTRPRRDREGRTFWAHAPYNFVSLADTVVPAPPGIPDQDSYRPELVTGRIECELVTCSPTYIRGVLSPDDFRGFGEKGPDQLGVEEKERHAPFFATDGTQIGRWPKPSIPGSSLRGMVRTLVEIIGFGRMRWVGKEPTFTFRAVAASRDDPLREPYRAVIGPFGRNVRAGYLVARGNEWWVQPALTPRQMGWPSDETFLKVKERSLSGRDLPAYIRLDDPKYRPQIHAVCFSVEERRGERGRYVAVTRLGACGDAKDPALLHEGRLVCSGNMKEAAGEKGDRPSPRRSHALVLMRDEKARAIRIREQTVKDYLAGLTPYQREMLTDWSGEHAPEVGCLGDLKPVFYVVEDNEVAYFGHSPNFRVPARLYGSNRAATPTDFVPDIMRRSDGPDLADAIFGWVEEPDGPKEQRSGRVSFGDAQLEGDGVDIWLSDEPIVPRTLGGPKATTFQHYLVQDARAGHDPDKKETLAHYGSPQGSTQLRGYKLYWHRGDSPEITATAKERQHERQLTRIVPVRSGVRFKFTLRFENLRAEELGALWWALALPAEPGKDYRHKLGMAKPLGMGSVKITPHLFLSERSGPHGRYGRLFDGADWRQAEREADGGTYAREFETYVLRAANLTGVACLADVERIRTLLAMLEWRDGSPNWLKATSYMELEAGPSQVNEYKERPVLPDPLEVLAGQSASADALSARPEAAVGSTPLGVERRRGEIPVGAVAVREPSRSPAARASSGRIKDWQAGKTYGFITPDGGGPDVFVHISGVVGGKPLAKGQQVTYEVEQGPQGLRARNVRLI